MDKLRQAYNEAYQEYLEAKSRLHTRLMEYVAGGWTHSEDQANTSKTPKTVTDATPAEYQEYLDFVRAAEEKLAAVVARVEQQRKA